MSDIAETTANTIGDIAARVATAMESAVKDYGPDAVELAMFAYQVEAIRTLLVAIVLTSLPLTFPWMWRTAKKYVDETDHFSYLLAGIPTAFMTIIGLVVFFNDLLNPALWLAAFDRPELMIATRALQAAGLL